MNHYNYFEYEYYTTKYKDLSKMNKEQAINHFKNHGIKEKRKFNKLLEYFDYTFYVTKYKDLSKMNYLEACNHYIKHGINENRQSYTSQIIYINNYLYESIIKHCINKNDELININIKDMCESCINYFQNKLKFIDIKLNLPIKEHSIINNKLLINKNEETLTIKNNDCKIILCTCIYKRPELTLFCLKKWLELDFYKILIVYSENEDYNNLYEYHNNNKIVLIKHNNIPVSKKWNKCINEVQKYEHDAIMILGSDDIISFNYLNECKKYINNQYDYISNTKWSSFIIELKIIYNTIYNLRNTYDGIGSGRVISKYLLQSCNYNIYNFDLNRGLDGNSFKIFKKYIRKIAYDITSESILCLSLTNKREDSISYNNCLNFLTYNYKRLSTGGHYIINAVQL